MSRKGKNPVPLPKGVEVKKVGNEVHVKGPKGSLKQELVPGITINVEPTQIVIGLDDKHQEAGNMHGLYRSLIHNMVVGVTEGYSKQLEMMGVGYRAAVQGNVLDLQVGLSYVNKN